MNWNRKIKGGIIVVILLVASLAITKVWFDDWRHETVEKWKRIRIGDSTTTLVETLGEPKLKFTRDSAPVNYYVDGYARKVRPINGSVSIYLERDLIMYVWLSPDDIVEDVFWGPS